MKCVLTGRVAKVALIGLTILSVSAVAQSDPNPPSKAKQTIFGAEVAPANFPNSTSVEWVDALASISMIGGHASFLWNWNEPDTFTGWQWLVEESRPFGLKVLFQIGTTSVNGPAAPPGFANSFGDAATRARFLDDVRTVALMQPDYLVLTTEVNLLYQSNRPEFENFRTLYAQAYDSVKATSPNTKVGVSYHYTQWYVHKYIDGVDVPALLSPSDFLAFTSYPEDLLEIGLFASISGIPASWHGYARDAYPNTPIIFSEIGWSSKPPYGSLETQVEFMRELPRLMSSAKPELITWALLTDVEYFQRSMLTQEMVAFLENLGVNIDLLFSRFNGLGLLDGAGASKPAFAEAGGMVFPTP